MARVTYGESITEYAGSIGGVTFLRNASGPIAKLRSRPPVNPSPYQSTYQNNLSKLVAFWPTLRQEDKDAWDALAAAHDHTTHWGVSKTLSGYQWFLSCNMIRLHVYTTVRPTPAAWVAMSPADQFTLETSATYIRLAWSPAYDAPYHLLLYASLPLRQSSLKLRRSLFYLFYSEDPGPLTYFDITTYIESLFNVTWSAFYASSNCSIIVRLLQGAPLWGYVSAFTSAIVKIG